MKKTKQQLVIYLTKYLSDCGNNDWFGYKMTDQEFEKLMMKKQRWEIVGILHNLSQETQKFITTNK